MDRRDFFKLAGVGGIALMTPFGGQVAKADAKKYGGPYYLLIHAGGGWDPTYLCDPKGKPINNLYTADQIGQVGAFKFAPLEYKNGNNVVYSNEQFFTKFQDKLLVVNGVDTTTANHDTGTRVMWSGNVVEGYPTFAALVAGAKTPGNPLGFISSGGYEVTGDLVPLTRLGNVDAFKRIAFPNRIDPNNPQYGYMSDTTLQRVQRIQRERLDDMRNAQGLPRLKRAMSSLYLARQAEDDVATLAAALPSQDAINNASNDLLQQAMVAMAGFSSGLAVAANLVTGGFDTHGDHDNQHPPRIYDLIYGVDLIMDAITAAGLDGKVTVIVGSDFGRTPTYNVNAGKDHWNITSMLMMGANITGGRVVGGTDDGFKALTFNPSTLAADGNGTRIGCDNVQASLRALAGITGSAPDTQFPVTAQALPLFA